MKGWDRRAMPRVKPRSQIQGSGTNRHSILDSQEHGMDVQPSLAGRVSVVTGMRRQTSGACLAEDRNGPAHRPSGSSTKRSSFRRRDAGEEALRKAYAHAEKLGKLIMEPRPDIARREWGRVRFEDGYAHVPFKVSVGSRPVAAVAKFANDSSVLKSCLATLVHVLCASHSMLFSARGGADSRSSIAKLVLQYVDAPPASESNVPVDSASLEAILRKACAEEDAMRAAESSHASLTSAHNHIRDATALRSEAGAMGGVGDGTVVCRDSHLRTTMDCVITNEVAHAMAFGYGRRVRSDNEMQVHLAQSSMLRVCGSLTRSPACINLLELGALHGVLPAC